MPQTRDHSNPLGQFLHKTAGIPAKYPEYDENSNRIFYVKSQHYYCSFCPNDGGRNLVRRDKKNSANVTIKTGNAVKTTKFNQQNKLAFVLN